MLIRRTKPGDIEALLALFDEVAAERIYIGTEPGYDREQKRRGFQSRIHDDESATFVAVWRFRNEGNRAAFAEHPEVYLPRFGGYDPVTIARGVSALNLFVFPHNTNALAFYHELGYVEIERFERDVTRQTGDVWDTILMRKTLA